VFTAGMNHGTEKQPFPQCFHALLEDQKKLDWARCLSGTAPASRSRPSQCRIRPLWTRPTTALELSHKHWKSDSRRAGLIRRIQGRTNDGGRRGIKRGRRKWLTASPPPRRGSLFETCDVLAPRPAGGEPDNLQDPENVSVSR
jgi:hypothetical protein